MLLLENIKYIDSGKKKKKIIPATRICHVFYAAHTCTLGKLRRSLCGVKRGKATQYGPAKGEKGIRNSEERKREN